MLAAYARSRMRVYTRRQNMSFRYYRLIFSTAGIYDGTICMRLMPHKYPCWADGDNVLCQVKRQVVARLAAAPEAR